MDILIVMGHKLSCNYIFIIVIVVHSRYEKPFSIMVFHQHKLLQKIEMLY